MTTCKGPKVKFEILKNKIISFNITYDFEYQDSIQQLIEKKVSFADSSIVFLHYSEEEIFQFRQRLRAQLQNNLKKIKPLFLNPSLYDSNIQNKTRSCFKQVEN